MSLNRTKPQKSVTRKESLSNPSEDSSSPSPKAPMSKTRAYSDLTSSKRKRECHEEEIKSSDFMLEMKKMFTDFKTQQNKKLEQLQSSINEVKQHTMDIQSTVEFICKQYEDFKSRLEILESERKNNMATIQSLEEKIENIEKSHRAPSIELRNIPLKKQETKSDLIATVIKIGQITNLKIQQSDIRDIYRINNSNKNNPVKPIIADFSSVIMKEGFLSAVKVYNRQHKDNRINSELLNFEGPMRYIYVSENLTSKTRRLFFLARNFAASNDYSYCWTAHGKIYLRKREGEPMIRIEKECDLKKLSGSD